MLSYILPAEQEQGWEILVQLTHLEEKEATEDRTPADRLCTASSSPKPYERLTFSQILESV